MSDDPGVLGSLPRSRPGQRSSKRAGASADGAAAPQQRVPPKQRANPPVTRKKATGARAGAAERTRSAYTEAPRGAERKSAGGSPGSGQGERQRKSTGATRPRATAVRPRSAPPQPGVSHRSQRGPVTGAIGVAGKVAGIGFKTASGILKRIPGPLS